MDLNELRIGIDLGGTKIEGIVLRGDAEVRVRRRVPTPAADYAGTVAAVAALARELESGQGSAGLPVGVCHPGAVSPASGLIKNANSTCLNGMPLRQDLERALGRPVAMANDADCLALSEAFDGAARGAGSAFAAILGTGCGGGIVVEGRLLPSPQAIAGEWGHNPLPWPRPDWGEVPGPLCWHGLHGCLETWISGSALGADYSRAAGTARSGEEVAALAASGDLAALAALERYEHRLARALAQVINLIDPGVIVLGGGVSRIERLYRTVPGLWAQWIFSDGVSTQLKPALHGDSSGVRAAARLWAL